MSKTLSRHTLINKIFLTYERGFSAFVEFRQKFGLANAYPISVYEISNFNAYLFRNEFSHSTVKCYLAGISFFCKLNNFEDNTQKFVVKKMLEGINRLTPNTRDFRLPVTREILLKLIRVLPVVCNSTFEATLYKAAFSMAFRGLLKE
jgi:hypothetical protein